MESPQVGSAQRAARAASASRSRRSTTMFSSTPLREIEEEEKSFPPSDAMFPRLLEFYGLRSRSQRQPRSQLGFYRQFYLEINRMAEAEDPGRWRSVRAAGPSTGRYPEQTTNTRATINKQRRRSWHRSAKESSRFTSHCSPAVLFCL